MSLSNLPDELILEIFACLIDKNSIRAWGKTWRRDYLSLAQTCKRFHFLGLGHYKYVHGHEPWRRKSIELHALNVDFGHPCKIDVPENYGICPIHKILGDSHFCYYTRLFPLVGLKYAIYTKIAFSYHRSWQVECLLSIDNPRLGNLTSLEIKYCRTISPRVLGKLLIKLKNVVHLSLEQNTYLADCPSEDAPVVERTLEYLFLDENRVRTLYHPLLHPNLRLPAKVLETSLPPKLGEPEDDIYPGDIPRGPKNDIHFRYIMRFKDKVHLLILQHQFMGECCCEWSQESWSKLARSWDMENTRCKRWKFLHLANIGLEDLPNKKPCTRCELYLEELMTLIPSRV